MASSEQRVAGQLLGFTLGLTWVEDRVDCLVEVVIESRDFLLACFEPFLALEVSTIGNDRPDLCPPLDLKLIDECSPDEAVVEELELRRWPVQDLF